MNNRKAKTGLFPNNRLYRTLVGFGFLLIGVGLALSFSDNAHAASPPTVTSTAQGFQIAATDTTTTGFDIYLDDVYAMSITLSASMSPVILNPAGAFCQIRAAAWDLGGLNHSSRSAPVANTANPACGTTAPITGGGSPFGLCIDTTVYNPTTFATISQDTHCF